MSTHDQTGGRDAPDDDSLAAEYVLHLLDADSRAQANDRLEVDGGFRALVAEWSERLVPLANDIDPVAPPPDLRDRLGTAVAESQTQPAARAKPRRRFSFGSLLGGGLAAAFVALLAVLFLPQTQPPSGGPVFVADVAAPAQELVVQASYDSATQTLTVRHEQGQAPEGSTLYLWLLTEDQPPHSVGPLPADGTRSIPVIPFWGQRIPTGQFAVSAEPPGETNDETGPRGEVLAVGQVQQL